MRYRTHALVAAVLAALALLGTGCAPGKTSKASSAPVMEWRWHAPHPASVGAPGSDEAGVAVTYGHQRLVLFAPDGASRWETYRLGVREQAPLLVSDVVLAPTDDGLLAVDRNSGLVRWDTRFAKHTSTPVVAGDRAIATSAVLTVGAPGTVTGVDLRSGAVAWTASVPGRTDGPPATDGHTVVVSWQQEHGEAAGLTAFDARTGTPQWSSPLAVGGVGGPAVVNAPSGALAVVVDGDRRAKAFALVDGRERWAAKVGGAGSPEVPPLALSNGRVLAADRLAGLTVFDIGGREQWSARGDSAAVDRAPVGPVLGERYVLPLTNGQVLVAGPGHATATFQPPGGPTNGAAVAPGGRFYVTTARGPDNQLIAYRFRS